MAKSSGYSTDIYAMTNQKSGRRMAEAMQGDLGKLRRILGPMFVVICNNPPKSIVGRFQAHLKAVPSDEHIIITGARI